MSRHFVTVIAEQ